MLAALALLVCSAPVDALPREKDKWIRVRTDNFTLVSNASSKRTLKMGENLERLRQVLKVVGSTLNLEP